MTNWKETPGIEEEKLFRKLKETTKKEKMLKEIGSREIEEDTNPKPNLKSEEKMKTKKVVCKDNPAETLNVQRLTDMFDDTSTRDCGN